MSDPNPEESPTITQMREQIEKVQKDARAASERAEQAERQLAFAKAGLSLDDKKLGYFIKGYEGDYTPDAIRSAATEAGFLEAPKVSDDESAVLGRLNEAPGGQRHAPSRNAEYDTAMASATSTADIERIAAQFGRMAHFE